MPPKKGTSTPNKPPENPTWTLDEGEEMRRDINELKKKMDSMEAKLDTKMDGLKGEIMEVLKNFVTEKTHENENASHEIHDEDTRKVNQECDQGIKICSIFKVLGLRRKLCHCVRLVFLIPAVYLFSRMESVWRRYRDFIAKSNRSKKGMLTVPVRTVRTATWRAVPS
jgi:hypothetical protein